MLENKREKLKKEIEELQNEINEKNKMLKERMEEENKKEEQAMKDHSFFLLKFFYIVELNPYKAVEILTQPKEENILLK